MNPLLLELTLKEKRRDLLEEAGRQQLIAIYNANNPGWWARSHIALGNFLIRLGVKLKSRYTRPLALNEGLCRE